MRVIAGTAKGTPLLAPKGLHVRPTLDRVKTAMFNLLMDRVEGAVVLDVFSGSGALGLEALSRGAGSCVFVERAKSCLEAIQANLERTGLAGRARVLRGDVFSIGRRLPRDAVFGLVLAAPPYRIVDDVSTRQRLWRWMAKLMTGPAFAADGTFVLEHRRQPGALAFPGDVCVLDTRTYGDTTLSLLCRRD